MEKKIEDQLKEAVESRNEITKQWAKTAVENARLREQVRELKKDMEGVTRYKIYDIEWDTDGEDESAVADLPKFEFYTSEKSLDELRDGAAADWLSDSYGFCVKSLKVDATDERMYTVYVTHVETYYLPVNVLAKSAIEARGIVKENDYEGKYDEYWDNLQPDTEMDYHAELADQPDYGEGPMA